MLVVYNCVLQKEEQLNFVDRFHVFEFCFVAWGERSSLNPQRADIPCRIVFWHFFTRKKGDNSFRCLNGLSHVSQHSVVVRGLRHLCRWWLLEFSIFSTHWTCVRNQFSWLVCSCYVRPRRRLIATDIPTSGSFALLTCAFLVSVTAFLVSVGQLLKTFRRARIGKVVGHLVRWAVNRFTLQTYNPFC